MLFWDKKQEWQAVDPLKGFRLEEKKFRHYDKAMEWEKKRFGVKHR